MLINLDFSVVVLSHLLTTSNDSYFAHDCVRRLKNGILICFVGKMALLGTSGLVCEVKPNILPTFGFDFLLLNLKLVLESFKFLLLLKLHFLGVRALKPQMLGLLKKVQICEFYLTALAFGYLLLLFQVLRHLVPGNSDVVKWDGCLTLECLKLD
jgi:hypothetical protein